MSKSARPPARPRPSATVAIVRDSDEAPEILMVQRRAGDAFGESYTYPGGVLDDNAADARPFAAGRTAGQVDGLLEVASGGLDYLSAVVRELFEETGILLAKGENGDWPENGSTLSEYRSLVDRWELPWSEFLDTHNLRIACDELHYFAFWVTPVTLPKRWSTRFFLAALPPGQEAIHDGRELTDSRWITAKAALAEQRRGELILPHPTIRTLEQLAPHNSIDALFAWADEHAAHGVPRFTSVRIEVDGKTQWLDPGDPGYPDEVPG